MQSHILISKIIVCISTLFLIAGCNEKKDSENQITITVRSVDSKTKNPRINMFDTIVIRKEGIGYLTKTYTKVGEYITDSTGSVKIKVDRNEGYIFLLSRMGVYGSENFAEAFTKEKLKDGQIVNIKAIPIDQ